MPANFNKAPSLRSPKVSPNSQIGGKLIRMAGLLQLGQFMYDMWKPFEDQPAPEGLTKFNPGVAPRSWTSQYDVNGKLTGWRVPGRLLAQNIAVQLGYATDMATVPRVLTGFTTMTAYLDGPRPSGFGNPYVDWRRSFTMYAGQYAPPARGNVEIDPFTAQPIGSPQSDPWSIPRNAPNYRPSQQAVTPVVGVAANPDPGFGFVIAPVGPVLPTGPYGRLPNVKERKYRLSGASGVLAATFLHTVSASTELLDFWNVLLDAMGFKYVNYQSGAGFWLRNPKLGDNRFGQQVQWFLDHGFSEFDRNKFLQGLVSNVLEDRIVGKISKKSAKSYLDLNRAFGHGRPVSIGAGMLF